MKDVEFQLTRHAIHRIKERGCCLSWLISYLQKVDQSLIQDVMGYEVVIPFKGRLVGNFDSGRFVVKSFLFPRFSHRNSARKLSVKVSRVLLPRRNCCSQTKL